MTAPSTMSRHPGSLLKELDLTKEQFLALLDRAAQLKTDKHAGTQARSVPCCVVRASRWSSRRPRPGPDVRSRLPPTIKART